MATFTATDIFNKLKDLKIGAHTCLFTLEKCEQLTPVINEINELKKQKNAIILAHSYVSPDILCSVADFVGDSYELSKKAKETDADIIVFTAVKFMAQTAKLLNPGKEVRMPNKLNGCSLADSITGADVKKLRDQYPDHTFVCYINTTTDVKAQCDICVTSSNVYKIVEKLPTDKIYFLPDKLMGQNLKNEMEKRGIHKTIVFWPGTCYVHEAYSDEMVDYIRLQHPLAKVVSHPECTPEVVGKSDFVGSTTQMARYVKESPANEFFMITECGLTSRLQLGSPTKKFIGTCTMCKYMKSNSLADIRRVLIQPDTDDIITLNPADIAPALRSIEQMFKYAES